MASMPAEYSPRRQWLQQVWGDEFWAHPPPLTCTCAGDGPSSAPWESTESMIRAPCRNVGYKEVRP